MRLLKLPPVIWFYGLLGAVLIIASGARLLLLPRRLSRDRSGMPTDRTSRSRVPGRPAC